MREFTDFQRRLTLPYYEEARQLIVKAINDKYFDGCSSIYMHIPINLKNMIVHYQE